MALALLEGRKKDVSNGFVHAYDLLENAVKIAPENGTYYIQEDGKEEKVTYYTQKKIALGILYSLQKKGLKKGDYIIADVSHTKNYHFLMWACFYGGIIITALPRPDFSMENSETLQGLKGIWEMLGKPLLVTDKEMQSLYEKALALGHIEVMEELFSEKEGMIAEIVKEDAAYIQFSSGSTGNRKGAVLSNGNLIEVSCSIADFEQCTKDERSFMWLPHTHNFGAFTFCLLSVILGVNNWSMRTETFVRNPLLFMEKVSKHQVTRICTNNLGLEILLQLAAKVDTNMFDLSHLAAIYIGAEKPWVKGMKAFIEAYHLKENIFRAGYGMSETVLTIASSQGFNSKEMICISRKEMSEHKRAVDVKGKDEEEGISFLEHGGPITNITIGIFDEKNQLLEENEIGSIRIKSPTVFKGYCNVENDESIFANGWFITGDLGFIRGGKLYITGRSKEMIIVRGVNYMLTDLDTMVENSLGGDGKVAFISSEGDEGEELIGFLEQEYSEKTEKSFLSLEQKIKNYLLSQFGLEVKHIIPVPKWKRTASRKLDRYGMKKAYEEGEYGEMIQKIQQLEQNTSSGNKVQKQWKQEWIQEIKKCWGEILHVDPKEISLNASFKSLGGNSVKGFFLLQKLEDRFQRKLNQNLLVRCGTVGEMAEYIEALHTDTKKENMEREKEEEVAITGMAFRLPRASTQEELWKILVEGENCVQKVSEKRKNLSREKEWDDMLGELEGIDFFDYEFFNISKEEADFMDPQQRLSLEVAYEALDDSGEGVIDNREKNIAVLGATSGNSYYPFLLEYINKNGVEKMPPTTMVGNLGSTISTRISHYLNSRGSAMAIDSACSSFMAALFLGEKMIKGGECQGALIVGANVLATSHTHRMAERAGILSKGNYTKVFDKKADGSILGEGAIAIYLEGLKHARKHKKNIYGVIAGVAMNNHGTSLSIMAPNPAGQQEVLKKAYEDFGVKVKDITYIEAHGTGTEIGDPIELSVLEQIFQDSMKEREKKIPIGSIKSNFGHLLSCGGGAGLIKVLLCLKNEKLAPSLHVEEVNPIMEKEDFPLRVITKAEEWKRPKDGCRYAGISSFGIGGTNVHMIIKDPPLYKEEVSEKKYHLLTVSAKDKDSLSMIMENLLDRLQMEETKPEDISFSLRKGRNHYKYRMAVVIDNKKKICGDKSFGMCYRAGGSNIFIVSEKNFTDEEETNLLAQMIKDITKGKCRFMNKEKDFIPDYIICMNSSEEFIRQMDSKGKEVRTWNYAYEKEERELFFQLLLKELYACGAPIDWEQVYKEEEGKRITLPGYPLKKTTAWMEW